MKTQPTGNILRFERATVQMLEKNFGLKRCTTLPALDYWLANPQPLSPAEIEVLGFVRLDAIPLILDWKEVDLMLHMIGPMVRMARLDNGKFRLFGDCPLKATIGQWTLQGRPDGLYAFGISEPVAPFMCLKEWKRSQGSTGDPVGQCLSAMLAAQTINIQNPSLPVYGLYVLGRNWAFMVLDGDGKRYAISKTYDATEPSPREGTTALDIELIVGLLRWLRTEAERRYP